MIERGNSVYFIRCSLFLCVAVSSLEIGSHSRRMSGWLSLSLRSRPCPITDNFAGAHRSLFIAIDSILGLVARLLASPSHVFSRAFLLLWCAVELVDIRFTRRCPANCSMPPFARRAFRIVRDSSRMRIVSLHLVSVRRARGL